MRARKPVLRFVRALLAAGEARRDADNFRVATTTGAALLAADEVRALQADGVLGGDARRALSLPETSTWLKRQLLEAEPFAAQHRDEAPGPQGTKLNLAESPLARLAVATATEPAFLERHHVEAGERLRRLVDRARLNPRLTMSYSARIADGKTGASGDITDMAADARQAIARLYEALPRDCAEIVIDVCGFEKGLQQIESERGWPRRSAKLVLRIGLDRLAEIWGIGAVAVGRSSRSRSLMSGDRVPLRPENPVE